MPKRLKSKSLSSLSLEPILKSRESLFLFFSFFLLAGSNFLLSYFQLPLTVNLWVILTGLLLPFFLILSPLWPQKDFAAKQSPLPLSSLFLFFFVFSALFLRLYRLSSLSSWPIVDEGMFGYFSTLLTDKWDWKLFHYPSQEPIFYFWGQSLFFKLFGVSLETLWLFPAVCSLLCLPAAYFAARKFFPVSTAFIATCFMAFGFWPLFMGRLSIQSILMVLWECLTFYALGIYQESPRKVTAKPESPPWFGNPTPRLLVLAFFTGAGFYIYLAWPVVALMIFTAIAFSPPSDSKSRLKNLSLFCLTTALLTLPLLYSFASEYRGYFDHLWGFASNGGWHARASLIFSYLGGLFWRDGSQSYSSGPLWGGYLNPLTSALFFLGFSFLLKSFRKPLHLWLLAALVLFAAPAFLTNNFQMMRLTPLLPLAMMVTALGMERLIFFIHRDQKLLFLLTVLFASTCLDGYHLFYVYPRFWEKNPGYYGAHKSAEFYKAYRLLKLLADQEGPGLILLNFNPDPYDQTLFTATYSFNAAANPRLDPEKAQWAAVLGNIHEEPYFKKIFPEGHWNWLSEGLNRQDGGFILEIIPLTPKNQIILNRWNLADQSLSPLTYLVMDLGVDPDQSQMMEVLQKAYSNFKNDLLLESRYWRIMALHHCAEGKLDEAAADYQKAIQRGGPQAHLYNELGCLWHLEKKNVEAEKAFEQALRLKPNLTGAAENLKNLLLTSRTGL